MPNAMTISQSNSQPSRGIKAFAESFGVTPRTIRFYEDKGLLTPQREGGVRIFGPRDRLRFEKIMRGKRLGFSLDDIRSVFDVTDGLITDRAELLRRKSNFEAVVAGLARRREDLNVLSKDMQDVISVTEDYLDKSTDDIVDVAALAAKYQAAFEDSMTSNPIDYMSGVPDEQP